MLKIYSDEVLQLFGRDCGLDVVDRYIARAEKMAGIGGQVNRIKAVIELELLGVSEEDLYPAAKVLEQIQELALEPSNFRKLVQLEIKLARFYS